MRNKFTIMLPVAKNLQLANECIEHLLSVSDLDIIVIDDFGKDDEYIQNERLKFIHNTNTERQGLTRIWNQCIRECPTEYPIIASWRPRPSPEIFKLIESKLDEGFGMVAPETLHFFSISKHLTTVMGWFDTGFINGQYEDTDTFNRLFMNDIALYVSEEIPEVKYPSMWLNGFDKNRDYFDSKWIQKSPELIQLKEEVNILDRQMYKYLYKDRTYKPFSQSELKVHGINNYYNNLYKVPVKRF